MENKLNETISILEKLVSFPTISGTSTREINKFIEDYLSQHGLEPVLSYDEDGERSNIFVTIGPKIDGDECPGVWNWKIDQCRRMELTSEESVAQEEGALAGAAATTDNPPS